MKEYLRTYIKVNLSAIENNINEVRKRVGSNVKILAVIKADSYGHGAVEVGKFLNNKVDYFAVATLEEALELRKNKIKAPILILGYTSDKQYEQLIKYDITATIYNLEMAEKLCECAYRCKKIAKIHIALETGMNRIGFNVCEQSVFFIDKISKMNNLFLEGIFTHFSCADETNKSYSQMQMKKYDEFIGMLEENNIDIPIKHICNSAGIIEFEDHRYNMVRSGIITYGLYPSNEVNKSKLNLEPALEWKAHVINIFEVQKGTGIGYGKTYITNKKMRIATISVGYADGYMRSLSSKWKVIIHGKFVSILGRICMDQMMVDITDIENVKIEDEVTLVGKEGNIEISVNEISEMAGSFNYEFICGIGKRVERVYI